MELAEKLRKIMREQYGIENDAQLIEAVKNIDGPDLGIFVTPLRMGAENAS